VPWQQHRRDHLTADRRPTAREHRGSARDRLLVTWAVMWAIMFAVVWAVSVAGRLNRMICPGMLASDELFPTRVLWPCGY
jgi:hypothetical protein